MLKFPVFSPFTDADFAWIRDNTSVIGMIASVRVSLTVTALFNVSFPRFHMLSQVDAAAVTEEVVVNCCSGEQSEGRTARCVKAEDMPKYRE